ncbi:CPBP family glutamic-type intramembrane protease [Calothrix sp. 336/3]|uniref:CPBP family glutamic-type intramembrane protease n=1 Tax=Calothrix sp. 336/3 TaxID=1337936 RepID=UPI0004E38DFF|nr:CPBP family glutamic-type intramembrane protease [Calothrix sp. 336/3]AKG24746.1 abortive phage infection protein [Calothrix sp. 336/3]
MRWKFQAKQKLAIFLLLVTVLAVVCFYPRQKQIILPDKNYWIHAQQSFNQPQYYPLNQQINPKLYQPVGNWVGRLILPQPSELTDGQDWVWMEVEYAPDSRLIGKIARLEWQNIPPTQAYLQAVTRDINFLPSTFASQKLGIIHPERLNQVRQVGALRSLAGARPYDDVIVSLDNPQEKQGKDGEPILQITTEPLLVTGRFYGLVKILQTVENSPEYFHTQHYNPISRGFDGELEVIHIPQQVMDTRKFFPSIVKGIEKSQVGEKGWYIYGAKDGKGIFTVQGIVPRSLLQLTGEGREIGMDALLYYLRSENWRKTPEKKGKISKIAIQHTAQSPWKLGDTAIILHLFGGIGGEKAESQGVIATVTGHFSFGVAKVIHDPFTQELKFAIQYYQVYAHNPNGIIAGKHSWVDYMGNLQWGWLSTRGISDVVVKLDAVTEDYDFNGIKLSALREFLRQLEVTMARYRVGDGTGSAIVTPATSCIQDSSQALFTTIQTVKQQVEANSEITQWLDSHPNHPQTLRFRQLASLGSDLEGLLTPLGIVRADWQSNNGIIAGTGIGKTFQDRSIWAGLTSWRTMMPRQAEDELATLFFRHGADLWFLRSNQVGGWQDGILPIAPTPLLGRITFPGTQISFVSVLINRFLAAIAIPQGKDWQIAGITLLVYGAIAIPLGSYFGFLRWRIWQTHWFNYILVTLQIFVLTAWGEELFFRVLILPYPREFVHGSVWLMWAGFSLGLFVIYHPINAKTLFKAGYPLFFQPLFLILASMLGIACTVAYYLTASLWAIALIHGIVLQVWLFFLDGKAKISTEP